MYKKYFSEHIFYFTIFTILSVLYILNGYASLILNDDWALRGMLGAKGIYGTLIMSYPLSYVMSHLYDFFPSFSWYSSLLTLVMALNFYLIAHYIAKLDSYIQKTILFIFMLMWLTFLWFNMSITTLTVTTMISAIGLIRKNLILSFIFIFLASLLRIDIMLIFIPYYAVSYFILRDHLVMKKREIFTLLTLILLVTSSLVIQNKDHQYIDWLAFNKARSAIVDMGVANIEKDSLSSSEVFCIRASYWQDPELFSSKKLISLSPSLVDIFKAKIQNIHLHDLLFTYKFKHWVWLLLVISLIIVLINIKNRRVLFIPLLVAGVVLLLFVRDVDRVSVPLFVLWAYVLFESLRSYRIINIIFLAIFTYTFYFYASGQFGYRYFDENTALQKEARQLIKKSNKVCEVSIVYPTALSNEVTTVFSTNYLFHEKSWIQMNDKEILPGGWLSRNKHFYQAHHISDPYTKRKYETYHAYLVDDKTAFFGSKILVHNVYFKNKLLKTYDKLYLKDKPNCKHKILMLDTSEHFGISQIRIDCNGTK